MSPNTIKTYRLAVNQYVDYLVNGMVFNAGTDAIRSFQRWLSENERSRGQSRRTTLTKTYAIRAFYDYLTKFEIIRKSPYETVTSPKTLPPPIPRVLTREEATRLIEAPRTRTVNDVRDRAFMEVLYSTAVRVEELTALNMTDWLDGFIHVRHGKGNKARIVPIGEKAEEALRSYLSVSRRENIQGREPLFLSQKGNRLSVRSVQKRLEHWSKVTGLGSGITPHTLRRSCATHILEAGVDIMVVKELLGHESVATTMLYLHLEWSHLKEMFDRCFPRAGRMGDGGDI